VKILVTGACGFVGSTLVEEWLAAGTHQLFGLDSLVRPGSELNRSRLRALGVPLYHGDIRLASDLDSLPAVDAVVDAAANPSVLAGVDGQTSSRQLVEHNLIGTVNLLEFCRRHAAAFLMLSTSRVYSIPPLAGLAIRVADAAFVPDPSAPWPEGLTASGVTEAFSTRPPISLYGATKLASEQLALEYGETYGFPVWINRCGVLAGAGQFGRADQGIFAYWVNSWLRDQPLRYIGFGGEGYQVRDCLHPADLVPLLDAQLAYAGNDRPRLMNVGGGTASARSLAQVSAWCREQLGPRAVDAEPAIRRFDIPWMVLDTSHARERWNWSPRHTTDTVLAGILDHARRHPDWLQRSRP
jgi:CDP-paratose 2-epimerase